MLMKYIEEFMARAAQVTGINDQHYVGYFLNGLKTEIRVQIHSHDTHDVNCTMTIAREVEKKLNISLKQEFLDLRAKRLCFRCKQPYHPLHKCPNKSLKAIIMGEDESVQFRRPRVSRRTLPSVDTHSSFRGKIGRRTSHKTQGLRPKVQIELGTIEVLADCFVFPLGGINLILGMA